MRIVDAGIDDRDDVRRRADREIPRGHGMEVRARLAARRAVYALADVLEAPELRKAGVVGQREGAHDVVRLGVEHVRPPRQAPHEGRGIEGSRPEAHQSCVAEPVDQVAVRQPLDSSLGGGRDAVAEPDEDLSRDRLSAAHHVDRPSSAAGFLEGRGSGQQDRSNGGGQQRGARRRSMHEASWPDLAVPRSAKWGR
jgi:hypothetical protein